MENWNKIGKILEEIIEQGMFPGIGYDVNGWQAWAFYENPIEGLCDQMRNTKVLADSATEAIEKLSGQVLKKGEKP